MGIDSRGWDFANDAYSQVEERFKNYPDDYARFQNTKLDISQDYAIWANKENHGTELSSNHFDRFFDELTDWGFDIADFDWEGFREWYDAQ